MKKVIITLLMGLSFSSVADYFPPNGDNIFEKPEPLKPLSPEQEFSAQVAKAISFAESYCRDGNSMKISSILASDKDLEVIEVAYPDYNKRYLAIEFYLNDGRQYSYFCPRS